MSIFEHRRFRPRRHDVGAALMLRFRPRDVESRDLLRFRASDFLHALILTMVCFTAIVVLNEDAGRRWSSLVQRTFGASAPTVESVPVLASRIAPDAPVAELGSQAVRLTLIEEEPEARLIVPPASLGPDALTETAKTEPAPTRSAAARRPLRAAALDLGDQALRAMAQ